MTDFVWPSDIVPASSGFKLQAHTGGTESPFSRVSKVYGLSAPRWTCSMAFRAARGSRWGRGKHVVGARLDGLIAMLRGRQNRIAIWDFDFTQPRGALGFAGVGNLAAAKGAASITLTGLVPGAPIFTGDYFGGAGRPYLITSQSFSEIAASADGSGHATITFEPPLSVALGANAITYGKVTALFRLASDDLGDNLNQVGDLATYELQFVEDL